MTYWAGVLVLSPKKVSGSASLRDHPWEGLGRLTGWPPGSGSAQRSEMTFSDITTDWPSWRVPPQSPRSP